MSVLPFSINPLRKKTPDELNSYEVVIDMSQTVIKKIKRLSPTSLKIIFDVKKPFPVNVHFETFSLDSLKSHFKNNQFKFKKFYVIGDFEKETVQYFMDEAKRRTAKKTSLKTSLANLSKRIRLNRIYKKIKLANVGTVYKNKRGKSEIAFDWGGRHERKFIPLPKKVNLHCTVDFSKQYQLNITNLRPISSKDISSKKENRVFFYSPELSEAIWKAMKNKVFGKEIKEEIVNYRQP